MGGFIFDYPGRVSQLFQDPRIDFQSEGAKNVLYLVSPEGTSMMDAEWGISRICFSRTQENAFLDAC